jgi:D-arabinan exo alpha-(1,3)/(1,5)-arabinofuranosidase (non-reducing end)
MQAHNTPRRGFLQRLAGLAGLPAAAAAPAAAQAQRGREGSGDYRFLPRYARAQSYKSLKQSSYDRTGGNADRWPIAAGATQELFNAEGPGAITHIWVTIAAPGRDHLKEIVLRAYWDGNQKPSIEAPIGDFFGLNLGQYSLYQSEFLNCSPIRALNCYFSMPFRRAARITATNEGKQQVNAFYSNIDYQLVPTLPDDAMYFHAQYRQQTPNPIEDTGNKLNPDGRHNYMYVETRGRGHLMGVTLGVLQNSENWMGEGDDMIFVDDESKPAIIGTGSEDYFCGAWDFGGREGAVPFHNLYNGAHFITNPERTGGRYCLYRWHADNPVTFTRYLRHTMEHGHANDRSDNFYSVAYWYQDKPYTDFPALPSVERRIPNMKVVNLPGGAQQS